ncbi:aspartate/glutamate racemase family protein [Bacillus inaquosorum]|uniref:aspartate/glutamate racemase family protein n=1 Tax=Bacillus inaquosorum TaxID=483913 RepID=UPI00228039A7|nr:aspartate/glutamate racemase family protein [Bacillus inaquosorum]MCY9096726.1 aspartate/glutamate racemase family protein [Bacillus inaquosorum]
MIGILAGMGPKSTSPFIDKVIDYCQKLYGASNDIDYPHMMIYSCPTPFYADRSVDHDEMKRAIINGAVKLEKTGVDFIALPCNTAHVYYEEVQQALSVPLLHIIEETIKEIPHPAKKAVVLGTEPTIQSAIYQKGLKANGQEVVHKDHWQQAVNQLIAGIKQPNHIQHTQALWQKLYEEISQHADIIISACTDLNAVLDHIQSEIPIIDSSDCLAKSTVSTYLAYQS